MIYIGAAIFCAFTLAFIIFGTCAYVALGRCEDHTDE